MKRLYALTIIAVIACITLTAKASLEQYSEMLAKKEAAADQDRLVRKPIQGVLDAGSRINNALSSGLSGNNKDFAVSLEAAEAQLKFVADQLAPLAERGVFKKRTFKSPRPLFLPSGTLLIKTGDDLLKAIATLARRSADAIARIRNGTGSDGDFAEIVTNSAVMSELILQFYGINSA